MLTKYTVIYENGFNSGSHYHAMIAIKHIETDNLEKSLKEFGCIYFVFFEWLEDVRIIEKNIKELVNSKQNGMNIVNITFIKSDELEQLQKDSKFLQKLRNAGVDNWEGYEDCLEED